MRLINTATLRMDDIPEALENPEHAIMSHKWLENEVSFDVFDVHRRRSDSEGHRVRKDPPRARRARNGFLSDDAKQGFPYGAPLLVLKKRHRRAQTPAT